MVQEVEVRLREAESRRRAVERPTLANAVRHPIPTSSAPRATIKDRATHAARLMLLPMILKICLSMTASEAASPVV